MTARLLAKIPLFSDLPERELEKLAGLLDTRELVHGEILFHEGEAGEDFFVVLQGELEVLKSPGQPEELLLNILREGESLGEMSLIRPGGQRSASVRARGKVVLLSMSRGRFLDLLRTYPEISTSLLRVLSQRLDATNSATFRDLTEKNRQLQAAFDELKAAQAQLIEKERLEHELQVAADIQLSILPDQLPRTTRANFGACMLPARQVGGDFYDVFEIDEDHFGVLIGDVADKGVPSALFMARVHALFMAEADTGLASREVTQRVNRHITRLHQSTQFVTVLYGILDLKTLSFSYSRAGHEPPLRLQPGNPVERLPHASGMAIGLWEEITLDDRSVELAPGQTLLLYTDGMTDCRNSKGEAYGLERIKRAFESLGALPAQEICDGLLAGLKDYQDGSKQDDDVTLVAIQIP